MIWTFIWKKNKSSNSGEEDEAAKLTDKGTDSNNKIGSLKKKQDIYGTLLHWEPVTRNEWAWAKLALYQHLASEKLLKGTI